MAKCRLTIMLDDELLKKLRKKQANLVKKSNKSVSLSQMINDYLEKSMKINK